jgi:hypothetical protein
MRVFEARASRSPSAHAGAAHNIAAIQTNLRCRIATLTKIKGVDFSGRQGAQECDTMSQQHGQRALPRCAQRTASIYTRTRVKNWHGPA